MNDFLLLGIVLLSTSAYIFIFEFILCLRKKNTCLLCHKNFLSFFNKINFCGVCYEKIQDLEVRLKFKVKTWVVPNENLVDYTMIFNCDLIKYRGTWRDIEIELWRDLPTGLTKAKEIILIIKNNLNSNLYEETFSNKEKMMGALIDCIREYYEHLKEVKGED